MTTQLQSDQPQTENQDRRRYPRHPIELQASLQFSEVLSLPCVIRNFCQGGVFCQLQHSLSPAPPRGTPLKLVFSLSEQGQEVHTLEARIVRATDNGVGIAFLEELSESLFEAFHELAQATQRPVPKTGEIPDSQTLRDFCLSTGKGLIQNTARRLMEGIEAQLLDASDMAENNTEKIAYIDASALCKQHSETIQQQFTQAFEEKVEEFFSLKFYANNKSAPSGYSLSLIDQNNFEDWLNLSESAAPIESHYQQVLRKLDYIFAAATQRSLDSARAPLIPTALLECLRKALESVEIQDKNVRKVIYRTYSELLFQPYTETLNAFAKNFGIPLDELPPVEKPAKNTASKPPAKGENKEDEENTDDSAPEAQSPTQDPTPVPGVSPQTPAPSSQNLSNLPSGILQSFAHQLQQSVQRSQGANTTPGQLLPPQQVVDFLPKLQQLAQQDWDAKQLEEQILAMAAENGMENPDLDIQAKGFIQASCQLSEALVDEAGRSQTIQNQLGQLRLPLVKIALTHPDLLEDENSPATEMINYLGRLDQYLAQNPVKFNQITQLLEHASKRLLQKDSDIQSTLEKTNARLRRLLAPLVKKQRHLTQRLINSYEGRQKIALSKRQVYQEVIKRLAGQPVPEILVNLSDAGWQHLLVLTLLRHGRESKLWKHRLGALDKLLAWLSTDSEKQLPQRQILSLLENIDNDLARVCGDVVRHREIMDELSAHLIGTGEPMIRKQPKLVTFDPGHFADPSIAAYIAMPSTDELTEVAVGDWLEIKHQGEVRPYKLLWIGEFPPLFVFIDATNTQKLELNSQQLAEMLADGRAKRTHNRDFPLMDRASDRILHQLYDNIVEQDLKPDARTGFLNSENFNHYLKGLLLKSRGRSGTHILCQMEFDLFRVIASVCGATSGESFLTHILKILHAHLPETIKIARLRENTIGLVLEDYDLDSALPVITRARDEIIAFEFKCGDHEYTIDTHVGLVVFSPQDVVKDILLNANTACMKAKDGGRNAIEVYREDDAQIKKQQELLLWAGKLNSLFKENRLFLRCQQIAPLNPDSPGHYEILIGANDEEGKFLAPDGFIPALEHFKRSSELDKWVIEKTMGWMLTNPDKLEKIGGFSINLSGQTVTSEKFLIALEKLLYRYNHLTKKLTFEITETAAVDNFHQAAKFIRRIKRLGCKFSLDDFGTGYASYAYLKHMDFDYLKIDGSFIKDIVNSPADAVIVKSMNDIGHSLGLKTVAEYVENEAILEKLKEIGLDYGQGYGIAKPIPLTELLP